jgi:hypothetical protein
VAVPEKSVIVPAGAPGSNRGASLPPLQEAPADTARIPTSSARSIRGFYAHATRWVCLVMRWTSERLDTARSRGLGWDAPTPHPPPVRIAVLLVLLAGCGGSVHPRPTLGAIMGLTRDHDSGDPVARAKITLRTAGATRSYETTSNSHGLYDIDHLPPGRYQLTATFAGQPIEVSNIEVGAGQASYVDIVFTLGRPEPLRVEYGDQAGAIGRYRPANLAPSVAIIEGTVSDTSTRGRVPGAVVTAVAGELTQQTVSDDNGRFRFDGLAPGTYSVSAYYSVGGRGQIEVRRSEIEVAGSEAVIVPLWIELGR